jgi:crotonobetainyl-CoA:carnitine CoA-transferase CaiB-like acyl-CoA transferase
MAGSSPTMTEVKPMKEPFAGIRILDFTRYVAGPFGTYRLA